METYIKGYVNGEPVYGEEYTAEEIIAQLNASSEWLDFKSHFLWSKNEGNKTLFEWIVEEKLGPNPELEDYKNLLKAIIAAGGVVRVKGQQYEFEVVPTVGPVIEPDSALESGFEGSTRPAGFEPATSASGEDPEDDSEEENPAS